MIAHSEIPSTSWQTQLREAVTCGQALLTQLGLQAEQLGFSPSAAAEFPVLVPQAFVSRMRPGDPNDPLLRQVLATGSEMQVVPGYGDDPLDETGAATRHSGIIQKYRGRVLLVLAGGCAVNCRYCFRRHFPYADHRNSQAQWRQTLAHVAADTSISEVILSGGDPLLVSDRALAELVEAIAAIDHVQRLRIHTRLPVVLPARVTQRLAAILGHPRLRTVMVIHSNHPNEIDAEVAAAMGTLRHAGIDLLNQAVLLAEVNDSADTLLALSDTLFAAGVMPYYLHLLDKVRGAAHFDVPEQRAVALLRQLSARTAGYLVPRLVREEPGAPAKTGIALD